MVGSKTIGNEARRESHRTKTKAKSRRGEQGKDVVATQAVAKLLSNSSVQFRLHQRQFAAMASGVPLQRLWYLPASLESPKHMSANPHLERVYRGSGDAIVLIVPTNRTSPYLTVQRVYRLSN